MSYACGGHEHGISRRSMLGLLAGAAGGLLAPNVARGLQSKQRQVLMIWLDGGMSQLESWDPKPGTDHGGPLLSTARFSHAAHFSSSALQSFSPLNSEIGTQISQLPLTAPVSGFTFSFNPSLGVVSRQTESFGPILTERADTIGKHRLFLGVSYQYFNFDKVDDVNLKNFGTVFQHESEHELCSPPNPFITCTPSGEPVFQQDVIATQNRIDLKLNPGDRAAVMVFRFRPCDGYIIRSGSGVILAVILPDLYPEKLVDFL